MKIKEIPINLGQWLSNALYEASKKDKSIKPSKDIPTNTILHKTLPGLGATYGELKIAKRHSIIIEPNVPVIVGKTKNKPQYLDVKGGCTKTKIKKYLKDDNIEYKKLLTTPESYHKVKEVCDDLRIDIYNNYFCLFDECEKLIQDVDYRDKITQPINDFFKFKNKAFVSATCLDMTHPEFEKQNFQKLIVKPLYDYRKNIDLIMTNNFELDVINRLNDLKDSECVCVFMNKTDSIDNLIYTLGIESESKVFCSDKSVKKLKVKGFNNTFDDIDLPPAKYNFFTCRFFSAVDIEIKQKPDILMLTNLDDANHTMIDPFSEAIQIYGRFRKRHYEVKLPFNSLTHITNFKPDMETWTKAETDSMIKTWENTYNGLLEQLINAPDDATSKAITQDLEAMTYNELLDDSGQFNYFSRDNLYNEERVKKYYTDPNLLLQAYEDTGHFIINSTINNYKTGDKTTGLLQERKSQAKDKRKYIIDELERVMEQYGYDSNIDDIPFIQILKNYRITEIEIGETIIEAYFYLGKAKIEELGYYYINKIKRELNKEKAKEKEKKLFNMILSAVKYRYPIGTTASKNEFKDFLTEEYRLNGIDIRVTQDKIKLYCFETSNNSANPATYTIQGYKSYYGEK